MPTRRIKHHLKTTCKEPAKNIPKDLEIPEDPRPLPGLKSSRGEEEFRSLGGVKLHSP